MTALRDLFGPAGPLAAALPEFRPRRGQQRMAAEVAEAIEARVPLVVEAGTGIGKTFAYLVPALLSGRRCVISTGTRTLQDQLFNRDLPLLARALGRPRRVVLLKGRANYLCLHRLGDGDGRDGLGLAPVEGSLHARVLEWSRVTRSGDLVELPELGEGHPARGRYVSTRESCLGQKCADFARCHVFAARRAAAEADIVVVNHHLLLADLALKEEGWGDLLPSADAVILDEAHQLPELAMQFFGRSYGSRQGEVLLQDLRGAALAAGLGGTPTTAENRLRDALVEAGAALRAALRPGQRALWQDLPRAFEDALDALHPALRALEELLQDRGEAFEALRERVEAQVGALDALLDLGEGAGARVVEAGPAGWTLRLLPFDVAARFGAIVGARPTAWIFTSATLAVGEDFTHFTQALGLPPETRAIAHASPFDYESQGTLLLPQGMPDPADPAYGEAVAALAARLVEASGGGAFLLFTSHRALEQAAARLRARWTDRETGELRFNVLVQGESPRERLLQVFRSAQDSVLLGTSSFWEGVDVKGQALRLVVIDRLPFASPDDPVTRARIAHLKREGRNPFSAFQVPEAAIALKQGAGRLIRGEEDRGLLAICDPRLTARGYGRQLLAALPPFNLVRSIDEACERLARLAPAVAGRMSA
jgi:ATP-dependent DNA helicase DinG